MVEDTIVNQRLTVERTRQRQLLFRLLESLCAGKCFWGKLLGVRLHNFSALNKTRVEAALVKLTKVQQ
jgi:hypothetical protein